MQDCACRNLVHVGPATQACPALTDLGRWPIS